MKTFLQLVAEDLYSKYSTDLSRVAVIFPNKRASLFFNQHLANLSDRPLWSCAYLSISELFQRFSSLKKGDSIQLVCELYQIYKEVTGSDESLDNFYFWGELLINDFDDVDKNLVDSQQIFSNLKDLKNILPEMDYLTPEEREAIERFFQHFNLEERSDLKDHFLDLWNVLGTIYERYNRQLQAKGIAYEGMLYRQVINQLDSDKLPYEKYVFVGFNVLNKVEHHLFQLLQEKGKALFYWDYDVAYFANKNHEAGEFIKRNLNDFPSELAPEHFNQLNKPKKICYIAAPTENVQARYLPEWTATLNTEKESDCAVVLCNESLLQPVVHSLPSTIQHSNVTMGFPLAQTPAFSYTCTILDLMDSYQSKAGTFHLKEVLNVLRHPYTQQLSVETAERVEHELTTKNRLHPLPSELCQDDWLTLTFSHDNTSLQRCNRLLQLIEQIAQNNLHTEEELIYTQLYQESLFKVYTTLMRFKTLMEEKLLTINTATFKLLLKRVLSTTSIPFHGEPVLGLQIMGVLETRNLDFKHLLMLSVNEGMLPKSSNAASFIPYNLRKAFGMTTIEHKNAVYAYYFYRLLQRAETVTILYNTTPDGINAGEMSRFLLQLLIDYPHTIERKRIETAQGTSTAAPIVIEKDASIIQRLSHKYELKNNPKALLSPSAMNMYLDCSLKFYFAKVANISPPRESTTEIDAPMFGTLFHKIAELIYIDLTQASSLITKETLQILYKDRPRIHKYVDNAFKACYFQTSPDEKPFYNGLQLINFNALVSYTKQLLQLDIQYAPFSIKGLEKKVMEQITFPTSQGERTIQIGGYIDRLDQKGDTLRIVDYKTGGTPQSAVDIETLFKVDDHRSGYYFQTFVYGALLKREQKREQPNHSIKIQPALLYIHKAANKSYTPILKLGQGRKKEEVTDYGIFDKEFTEQLQLLLGDLFNPSIPFVQTTDEKKCAYCDFKNICKR